MSSEINETRRRILDATAQSLVESRGRGAKMGEIAKAAGISRQAVYLHFASRSELLIAAFRHLGDSLDVKSRLAPSRTAKTGVERVERYIEFWGSYLPEIYGLAKALLIAQDTDVAAADAWRDRMVAMRDGCRAAIDALVADGMLADEWKRDEAIDAFMALLQVSNWEYLTQECGWTNERYIERMKKLAERSFVSWPGQSDIPGPRTASPGY
ncbi:MAG: TetR/AcrR family transcriptional regulator [Pseudomonadota bacterium]